MNQISDVVKKFFADFEQASNTFDSEVLAAQFSDPFMAANPDGGIQIAQKDAFIMGTAKRGAFFQSIGFLFVKASVIDEILLDDHYLMAKVKMLMRFEKIPGHPIDLENNSTFILFRRENTLKIVFNLTHEDLMKIMVENGLVPKKP